MAAQDGTGDVAVFQYVHPNYELVTQQHIDEFSGEKTCCECGDPTEPMPVWLAERILKAHPYLVLELDHRWEGICSECAQICHCPHCSGQHTEDDSDDEDSGEKFSTHPYH
jgi:hypothetical protein